MENLINLENVIIEQVAISNKNEIKNFYFVKEASIHKLKKHWSSGIGSFNKQHIFDHKSKRFKIEEEDIEEVSINTLRFKDIVEKYQIKQILQDCSYFDLLNFFSLRIRSSNDI